MSVCSIVRVAQDFLICVGTNRAAYYYGETARYHYFQCQQLILRLQVSALTKLWDLPPEFEVIIYFILFSASPDCA